MRLVVSDAHDGLVEALRRCFQGATWKCCQTHFGRNILDKTPAEWKEAIQEGLGRDFEAEDPATAREHFERLAEELEGEADAALDTLDAGLEDAIAVLRLPENKYWRRLLTTNTLERLTHETLPDTSPTRSPPGGCLTPSWPRRMRTGRLAGATFEWTTTSGGNDSSRPPRRRFSRRPERWISDQAGDGIPQHSGLDRLR